MSIIAVGSAFFLYEVLLGVLCYPLQYIIKYVLFCNIFAYLKILQTTQTTQRRVWRMDTSNQDANGRMIAASIRQTQS